jgi:hypothetical protein
VKDAAALALGMECMSMNEKLFVITIDSNCMQSKIPFTFSLWQRGEKYYPVALGGGGGGGFIHARVLRVLKLDGSLKQ